MDRSLRDDRVSTREGNLAGVIHAVSAPLPVLAEMCPRGDPCGVRRAFTREARLSQQPVDHVLSRDVGLFGEALGSLGESIHDDRY